MPGESPNPLTHLGELPPKDSPPASARILNSWISRAQERLGLAGSRLAWLVAASVVAGVLQRLPHVDGAPVFLVKGGTLLHLRLPSMGRVTRDLDGVVRGDLDHFFSRLDDELPLRWGPLTVERGEIEVIGATKREIQPRRFDVLLSMRGLTWRRIPVEISADEGEKGVSYERVAGPALEALGLPSPGEIWTLSIAYQIAQKVHAVTEPHRPPETLNDRVRDVIDLVLLRGLMLERGNPSEEELARAIADVFDSRAQESIRIGAPPRHWPQPVVPYPHWVPGFRATAESVGISASLEEVVSFLNGWLSELG